MSPTRNTARKTTGTHAKLSTALKCRPSPSPEIRSEIGQSLKHVRQSCLLAPGKTSVKKEKIFCRPTGSDSPPAPNNVQLFGTDDSDSDINMTGASTSETLAKSRASDHLYVLDKPITLCTRFATWLESQKHVHDDALLRAVERDGAHFLRLAKAALLFDDALRGHISASDDVLDNPLREHARTLRVFAQFLRAKVAENTLGEELQTAVLRDGEALFRLAVCCLDFDQAIRGPENRHVYHYLIFPLNPADL